MKTRLIFSIVLGVAVILSLVSTCTAQKYIESKENLRGIKAFYVLIEPLSPQTQELGINEQTLREYVDSALRKAAINITASETEFLSQQEIAQLYVDIANPLKYKTAGEDYIHTLIHITVMQKVDSPSESTSLEFSNLWHRSKTSSSLKKDFAAKTRDSLKKLMDAFASEYLEVNPKSK
jgi:hypothetical protein